MRLFRIALAEPGRSQSERRFSILNAWIVRFDRLETRMNVRRTLSRGVVLCSFMPQNAYGADGQPDRGFWTPFFHWRYRF